MDEIAVGPEAKKLLRSLFLQGCISAPAPLSGDEVEALCLLTGLQVVAVAHQTPAFKAEVLATMRAVAKRTGSPLFGATIEAPQQGD